ncbi:hypothetical protein FQR65_LT11583 [Abscondita terminalis]|nr:hypothetical protein FQR65_LT11583 [Abscondita terminalis]
MNALIIISFVCLAVYANASTIIAGPAVRVVPAGPATLIGASGVVGPNGAAGPAGVVTANGAIGPNGLASGLLAAPAVVGDLGLGLAGVARIGGLGLGLGNVGVVGVNGLGLGLANVGVARVVVDSLDDGQWHGEGLLESQDLAGAQEVW